MADRPCRVCGLAVDEVMQHQGGDALTVRCQRCGEYAISGSLLAIGFPTISPRQRAGLMAAIRDAAARGERALLLSDTWEGLAQGFADFSIAQKMRRLLEYVGAASGGRAGAKIRISDELEYPRFAALDQREYHWLRQALFKQGLIEADPNDLSLTLAGWEAYRPNHGGAPGTCFVAMSFEPELNPAYDHGIAPAVTEDCRLSIVRVDRVEHNDNINDRIVADIRGSQFVVSDFTFHRNGVYFEAGFALGLGRPVIWTCRRDQLPKAHFDTRSFNHIVWDEPADLREKLANRIRATILV